jgi:amino acid transporter
MPAPGVGERRGLRLLPLVAVIFCLSAAGPFGIEEIVSASGPGLTVLLILVMPIFYGLPLGLAAGEMGSRFPIEGGYYRWMRRMFGDFWGFQTGWCAWIGAFCDGAAYAVLVREYGGAVLAPLLPESWAPFAPHAFCLMIIAACTWANLRGIELVGWSTLVFSLFIVAPFLLLFVLGLPLWGHNPLLPVRPPDRSWIESLGVGSLITMWSYSGYESLSTAAEELDDPRRNYIRAVLIAIAVTVPVYLLPLLTILATTPDWSSLSAGSFADLGYAVGGPLLGTWIAVAGIVANVALFNTYTLAYSRIPFAMAQDGFLPRALARTHPVHGTPWVSLLLGAVIYAVLTFLPLKSLLVIEMWLFSFVYILIYLALWRLRRRPDLDGGDGGGGYRFIIPAGRRGIWWVILPPMVLIVVAMFGSGREYILYGGPALISGAVLYPIAARLRRARGAPS